MKETLTVPKPRHRAHRVLFQEGSPFKPKTVERKNLYRRAPKHRKMLGE